VLIYFDRATQRRAIVVLKRLLKPKGVLFVAPAETGLPLSHDFVRRTCPWPLRFGEAVATQPGRKGSRSPHEVFDCVGRTGAGPVPRPAEKSPRGRLPPHDPVRGTTPVDIGEAMRLADQGHFVEAATSCAEHCASMAFRGGVSISWGSCVTRPGIIPRPPDYYRKALYLEPDHYVTQVHLALLMEKQGDMAGAKVLRNARAPAGTTAQGLT
jgi:chemotaxis protein methyltransferase WspC